MTIIKEKCKTSPGERLDKIRACFLGYAIGDALGKGTEFMSRDEIRIRYPQGLRSYSQIIRDAHRSLWKKNQWTNDTDLVLLTADEAVRSGGFDVRDHAKALYEWGKDDPGDICPVMRWVFRRKEYLENPLDTAQNVWDTMTPLEATNEALGRAMVASLVPECFEETVRNIVRLTHCDTRCVSSGLIIGRIANDYLWRDEVTPMEALEEICLKIDERTMPYLHKAYNKELEDFELDDPHTYWYTRKAMVCAIWALLHCDNMRDALFSIVDMGGDADTNAALALAMLGLKYGTKSLPQDLVESLNDRERVEKSAEEFADLLDRMTAESTMGDNSEMADSK